LECVIAALFMIVPTLISRRNLVVSRYPDVDSSQVSIETIEVHILGSISKRSLYAEIDYFSGYVSHVDS
jgi:hypothetical protein